MSDFNRAFDARCTCRVIVHEMGESINCLMMMTKTIIALQLNS